MGSKKINLNKFLGGIIAAASFLLVSIFVAICLLNPMQKVKAATITKAQIINDYNINFVTAKTKLRKASSYTDNTDNTKLPAESPYKIYADIKNSTAVDTYVYEYAITSNTQYEYFTVNNSNIIDNSNNQNVSIAIQDGTGKYVQTATSCSQGILEGKLQNLGFIPENATHFRNVNGNIEELFYDEFNDNDFVMLDNYNLDQNLTDNKADTYSNIENIYVAFGTPILDFEQSTPLNILELEAKLYTKDKMYYINTKVEDTDIDGNKKLKFYNQYFDLRSLSVKDSVDGIPYNIANCEGRYEFKFSFKTYNKDLTVSQGPLNTFTYSFYLIDSANYTEYPTFSNATNPTAFNNYNSVDEYLYHFEKTDAPTLTYNPERFNIAYTRENNQTIKNITSTFSTETLFVGGVANKDSLGIITYKNNNKFYKRVYILAVSPNDGSQIDYIYLSTFNENLDPRTLVNYYKEYSYENFLTLLDSDNLTFEYKKTQILKEKTIYSYKTTEYDFHSSSVIDLSKSLPEEMISLPIYNIETTLKTQYEFVNSLIWRTGKLGINYTYDLVLEELGRYDFKYTYICPTGTGITASYKIEHTVNENKNLVPSKYYAPIGTKAGDTTNNTTYEEVDGSAKGLSIVMSGIFNDENKLTILDNQYTYFQGNLTINNAGDEKTHKVKPNESLEIEKFRIGDTEATAIHQIQELTNGKVKLIVTINWGTQTTKQLSNSYTHRTSTNKNDFVETYISTQTEFTTTGTITSSNIGNSKTELTPLFTLVKNYEYLVENIKFDSKTTSSVVYGQDKLHIYGSIAYFSKKDESTDSSYAKMKLVNTKYNQNYFADVTSLYANWKSTDATTSDLTSLKGFAKSLISAGKITRDNIIVTDMQVMWKNLSTLVYGGVDYKISQSYIHKYEYTLTDTSLTVGNLLSTERFTKDMYCQNDGLYEVEIYYTYNSCDNPDKIHYQLFTFIVDNSSPKISVEVLNDDNKNYSTIGYNKYTNRNVKVSWEIPTYFKNNIYLNINKTAYDKGDISFSTDFNGETAKYDKATNIYTIPGASDYLKSISTFKKDDDNKYYEIYFALPTTNPNNYNLDGNYKLTLYYGSYNTTNKKQPHISEYFIIDTKNISNMKVMPIMKSIDSDGKQIFKISDLAATMGANQQIINTDFTFRYDPKASGATIYTYWYKIPLVNASAKQLINTKSSKLGVTTNMAVAGDNAENESKSKQYIYDFQNSTTVSDDNCFIGDGSALYLFEMYDDAGNTCRFVIFYDTTTPMHIVTPQPNNSNNIVSQTTQIIWGDYKVIKINTIRTDLQIDLKLGHTTKYTGATELKNIDEILSYINNFSKAKNFNNAIVEKSSTNGYYILIPIHEVQVNDEAEHTESIKGNSNFYFFPVTPFDNEDAEKANKITLPTSATPYNITSKTSVKNISDVYGQKARTFFDINYGSSSSSTKLNGVYGSGLYIYYVFDELGNNGGGDLWMNLDQTQTMAYGTFDYDQTVKQAQGLTGEQAKSYSMAKMYISSLQNIGQNQSIPDYTLTYTYFPLNTNFYKNNTITKIELEEIDNSYTDAQGEFHNDTDETSYLIITYKDKSGNEDTINYPYTDFYGKVYPARSFPYDLEGEPVNTHVYNDGTSLKEPDKSNTIQRTYSSIINATTNVSNGSIVTQEGLYIFKREYTSNVEDTQLGNDQRIIYRTYYVDRSGIINVPSSTNTSSALFSIGETIKFELGKSSKENNNSYLKLISAENIQNNTTLVSGTESNNSGVSAGLFKTNKVKVDFTLTYDKFDYTGKFYNKYSQIKSTEALNSIFNKTLFNNLFKLDLKFMTGEENSGNVAIIDETSKDKSKIFDTELMKKYLGYTSSTAPTQRDNYLSMFYGLTDNYLIRLTDQSGYILRDSYNNIINSNAQANTLAIDFNINHKSPYADTYGKYYEDSDNYNEKHDTDYSIPIISPDLTNGLSGNYNLINRYLKGNEPGQKGQLKILSESQVEVPSSKGTSIELISTNNKTLVVLFSVTNDEYMAQIDVQNIKIYKDTDNTPANLIFNRVNGQCQNTNLVSALRQQKSFIKNTNTVDGVDYYAIIIFDDNLDQILTKEEKDLGFGELRLLDADKNNNKAKYYIHLNYVGDKNSYQQATSTTTIPYYDYSNSTYIVTIDRIKPMYNLTKLMSLDKYVYNKDTENKTISASDLKTNYATYFESWFKNYYGAKEDVNKEYNVTFTRSDLETYFFALDTRQESLDGTDVTQGKFIFEKIDKLDSNDSIYIRKIDNPLTYKTNFSYTPDDYEAYNHALYRGGNPQFVPANAIPVETHIVNGQIDMSYWNSGEISSTDYYQIKYINDKIDLSAYVGTMLKLGSYYEIIEQDEAGNYRVYGIYLTDSSADKLTYQYKSHEQANLATSTLSYTNSMGFLSGVSMDIVNYTTQDMFLKAKLEIIIKTDSKDLKIFEYITYNPITQKIRVFDENNKIVSPDSDKISLEISKTSFINKINERVKYYNSKIANPNDLYYSKFGHTVNIKVIDRLGIPASYNPEISTDFEIDFTVAGSILTPIYEPKSNNLYMYIPSLTGTTYITSIKAYRFNKSWNMIDSDASSTKNLFNKQPSEFKAGKETVKINGKEQKVTQYILNKGVYKFEITDNFNRTTIHFKEFNVSSSQTGGSLKFSGSYKTQGEYKYSANQIQYIYDSSVYDVYIQYTGKKLNNPDEMLIDEEIFNRNTSNIADLSEYGITSIITSGDTTTITFGCVDYLSKYHIKTILATTSSNYTWNDEHRNPDIFVYDNKIAVYTAISNVEIKDMKGAIIPKSNNLHLTEDIELIATWTTTQTPIEDRYDFNPKIVLERKYTDRGVVVSRTYVVSSGYIVTQPGTYKAYVINDLGKQSTPIEFTRGQETISMYAVYAVNKLTATETKILPSNNISISSDYENLSETSKSVFHYYVTNNYMNFYDTNAKVSYDITNINASILANIPEEAVISTFISTNTNANQYVEVRVNSNVRISAKIYDFEIIDDYNFTATYMIYSEIEGEGKSDYIYRYVMIHFVQPDANKLLSSVSARNTNATEEVELKTTNIFQSVDKTGLTVTFKGKYLNPEDYDLPDNIDPITTPLFAFNTIYVERYYNNQLAEIKILDSIGEVSFDITAVGLHTFKVYDLAGRVHEFPITNTDLTNGYRSDTAYFFLINKILFTVNGENPINNQIFNGKVDIDIIKELEKQVLYDKYIGITAYKEGDEISVSNNDGHLSFKEPGSYEIRFDAFPGFGNSSNRISSSYCFEIVRTDIAKESYGISKGNNFTIEKIVKYAGRNFVDMTYNFKNSPDGITNSKNNISANLIWLDHATHGNSIFEITLKSFDSYTNDYALFTFKVWINNELPTLLANVEEVTKTTDTIILQINPYIIYNQVGKCKLVINNEEVLQITETSSSNPRKIALSQTGQYVVEFISDDGTFLNSYIFNKVEPMNNTTKIVLIAVGIGAVVVGVMFIFIRKKGKYR